MKRRDFIVSRTPLPGGLMGQKNTLVSIKPVEGVGLLGGLVIAIFMFWFACYAIWFMFLGGEAKVEQEDAMKRQQYIENVEEPRSRQQGYYMELRNQGVDHQQAYDMASARYPVNYNYDK